MPEFKWWMAYAAASLTFLILGILRHRFGRDGLVVEVLVWVILSAFWWVSIIAWLAHMKLDEWKGIRRRR